MPFNHKKEKIVSQVKGVKVSISKLNKNLKKIKNKTYTEALKILALLPKKNNLIIWKCLYSAAANAKHNLEINKPLLIVQTAFVNQAGIIKKISARAKGKTFKIEKKTSNLYISLSIKN